MLVFIDESGHPHPNDQSKRPVVTAVCISDRDSRTISGRVHSLKRDTLGHERMELKGKNLINRPTFRRKPELNQFLEEFFSTVLDLPVTIFAMIMAAPFPKQTNDSNLLPKSLFENSCLVVWGSSQSTPSTKTGGIHCYTENGSTPAI